MMVGEVACGETKKTKAGTTVQGTGGLSMFRSAGDTLGGHGAAVGSLQGPVNSSAIGKIKTAIGSVTITRANAIVAQPAVGDLVYQGDLIETGIDGLIGIVFVDGTTFHLHASARMVLNEFIYGA